MKRIFASLMASCLLIAGCGKLRSPDFVPALVGIQVAPATAAITSVSQTVSFAVVGVYTTPPGTVSSGSTIACPSTSTSSASGLCTLGTLGASATFAVSNPSIASISSTGVASALKNGTANIVASAAGFQSAPASLTVTIPVLTTLSISPLSPKLALGQQQLFSVQGTYSNSPGTLSPVNETVHWSSFNTTIATVSPAQGTSTSAQSLARGSTNIIASAVNFDGTTITDNTSLTVGPPDLTSIVLTPSSLSIPAGATLNLLAQGIYTNSTSPQTITGVVSWSSSSVATANPSSPNPTTVTAGSTPGSSAFITASSPNLAGTAITANANVSVTAATLTAVSNVAVNPNVVAPTFISASTMNGLFSNGTTAGIPNSSIDWTSSDPGKATIDTSGLATGVAQGNTNITGTLKSGVSPSVTSRSAMALLTVTDPICISPILASAGATTTTSTTPTCVSCTVSNPNFAIDNDVKTFATMSAPLALNNGTVALNANSATLITPVAGQRAGFIISRPAGQAPSAGLMTQLTINTLDAAGNVVQTSMISDPLRFSLVGQSVSGSSSAQISLPVTLPFSSLQIQLNSGSVSAQGSVQVNSACAAVY